MEKKHGFSLIYTFVVIIVAAAVAVGSTLIYRQHHKRVSYSPPTTASSTNSKVSTTPPPTNACQIIPKKAPADWKTFTSNKFKFDISYPPNWNATTSGGAENNSRHVPILTELLFTPAGNQGPLYGIEVTNQSLAESITDWESTVKEARSNSSGTLFTILGEKSCLFDGHNAERIDTKQSYGSTTVFDVEFYVAANEYSYKFSSGYQGNSDPFKDNSSLLSVVESLSIK